MTRFAGYPSAEGLWVLDTWTGEVVLIRAGSRVPEVLRPGVAQSGEGPSFTPFPTPAAITDALSIPVPPIAEPSGARVAEPLDPLDRAILEGFPYPVAAVWRTFLSEDDPRQRCSLLVDAFTALLKLWALTAIAEYLASDVKHPIVNSTLERDLSRPLISTWNVCLSRTLPVLSDAKLGLLCPELPRAYDVLEAECSDRVAVSVPYETTEGERRQRISRLGKISALIRYRNGLAHGFHQTREKAEEDLVTWEPVLRDVLGTARFVERYPLFVRGATEGVAHRLMGATPSGQAERLSAPLPPLANVFMTDEYGERALPLPVLLDTDPLSSGLEAFEGMGADLVLFEGTARRSVVYVAAADGTRLEKQGALDRWKAILKDKSVEGRAMDRRRLSAEWLAAASERQVGAALAELTAHHKYLPRATVERDDLAEVFARFEHGDYRALVLAGEGGVGKTTVLARAVERWRADGDVVVFLRGASVGRPDLGRRVLRELAVKDLFFDDFLEAADGLFEDRRLRVVLDGIDEHPDDPAALVRSFDGLVEQAADHPWVRLLASVRTAAYRRIADRAAFRPAERRRYVEIDEAPFVEVGPLPESIVPLAYEKHRDLRWVDPEVGGDGVFLFRPNTAFSSLDLDGTTVRLLRNPLMLRLLCAAHHRRALPSHLSASDAFEVYLDSAVAERDAPGGGHPQRLAFLRALVRHLADARLDAAPRDTLYEDAALRPALENPHKDSPYVALLDLGVLREEWEDDRCVVRFAFAGLLEHLLAEMHAPGVRTADSLITLARRALSYRSLREALVMLARRLVTAGRSAVLVEALDVEDGDPAAHALLASIAVDVLVLLGRYGDESLAPLLRRMAEVPTKTDLDVLVDAFDRLFSGGETEAAERVLQVAFEEARALRASLAQAELRTARIEERRGDTERAREALERARLEPADARVRAEVGLLAAKLALSAGRLDEAQSGYVAARLALEEAGALGAASAAVRGLASVAGRRDAMEEQQRLIERAIELAREGGDAENLSRALNNLGRVHRLGGRLDDAERCLRESIEIKRALGDRLGVATTELNLGSVLFSRGQLEQARRAWSDALELCVATQHSDAEAVARLNLALAARWSSDPSGVEHARAAFERFERKDDPRGMTYALFMIASHQYDAGQVEDAARTTARLLALRTRTEDRKPKVYARVLEVRGHAARGEVAAIVASLEALRAVASEHGAEDWDLEDGPVDGYIDGARALRAAGHEAAEAWASRAMELLGERTHPRAERLSWGDAL